MAYKFRKSNRVMLGEITDPEMIIYDNSLIDVKDDDNVSGAPMVDCQIRLYLGGKPITLHNDSSDAKSMDSIIQYIEKLEIMRDMVSSVFQASKENPDNNYLDRKFLNPPIPDSRLFGGTLLVHYHGRYKMFTVDICDCSNKSRKSFNNTQMENFVNKFVKIIDESLVSVLEIKGML